MSALLWQIFAYVCLKLFKGDICILVMFIIYFCVILPVALQNKADGWTWINALWNISTLHHRLAGVCYRRSTLLWSNGHIGWQMNMRTVHLDDCCMTFITITKCNTLLENKSFLLKILFCCVLLLLFWYMSRIEKKIFLFLCSLRQKMIQN